MNMDGEELMRKMLEFIETQDGDYFDEWYASPREFASTILTDFAKYLGMYLVVPEFVPKLKKPEVDRHELLKKLQPEITKIFEIEYKKMMEKNSE
jgi:hypothetical protein